MGAAGVLLAGVQAVSAASAPFVPDPVQEAVRRLYADGVEVVVTRGRVSDKLAHRIVSPALKGGAVVAEAGAASTRDQARAVCRAFPPAGAWDLPDLGEAFFAATTVGALFGPEHFSRPVIIEEREPGREPRGAYLVWLRGADERDEARLAGTDKLYMFLDGNGGAFNEFISLDEARAQMRRMLADADKLPPGRREEAQRQAKRLHDAVKDDIPVFCVSGLTP